jgi:hypothetical protein
VTIGAGGNSPELDTGVVVPESKTIGKDAVIPNVEVRQSRFTIRRKGLGPGIDPAEFQIEEIRRRFIRQQPELAIGSIQDDRIRGAEHQDVAKK